MRYNTNIKNGEKLSVLGCGCMRFPKDEAEAAKLFLQAIDRGINYFDTAYIYGNNEEVLGRILAKNPVRDKIRLATKLPCFMVRKTSDFEKFFNTQLERLGTDYIDYYLMHMLADMKQWDFLRSIGIEKWIEEKLASGKIRNIGFSYHGGQAEFKKIIDSYDWGFCLMQYNYLDENSQAGKSGLQYAAAKGMAVMIMEPLRGGTLTKKLPKEAIEEFSSFDKERSAAAWGLRWVWNHPEVTTVLSGMGSEEMLEDNIKTAESTTPGCMTPEELAVIDKVRQHITKNTYVPCTGCNYCMPCPKGVDIPICFSCYNNTKIESLKRWRLNYMTYVGVNRASKCSECGACEKRCPQGIPIRKELQNVKKVMEVFPYNIAGFFANKFLKKS